LEESRTIRGLSTSDKKSVLTAQVLANRWHIGLNRLETKIALIKE